MSRSSSLHHGNAGTIRVRLRELAQLFNSMDPSPFLDRDLDADAEEFIVGHARELPADQPLKLVIHLATAPPADRAADTPAAVGHYFAERADAKRREFCLLLQRGRVSLVVGLGFLAACLTIGNLVGDLGSTTLVGVLKESFIIGGWVAMWRPLEIYLYDWWPLRAEWRVLQKLSRMKVELVVPDAPVGAPSALG